MSDEKDKPIEGHEYDGISELDNPLPDWWLWTFFFTIMFAMIYSLHYHTGTKQLISDEYAADVRALEERRQNAPGPKVIDSQALAAMATDAGEIAKGKKHFQNLCVSCHGAQGQGGIGPNLTDAFWLHGRGELTEIAKVVQDGVLDKGMPAWGQMLKGDEVFQVVAFLHSLKGTNPEGAKAPQGTKAE